MKNKISDNINNKIRQMEEAYLESGELKCPVCGSGNVDGTGENDFSDDYFWNEMQCYECGSVWEEIYGLIDCEITVISHKTNNNEVKND